jgi:hypothetical protein
MAEVAGFVSTIAGLITLAGQVTKLSYNYILALPGGVVCLYNEALLHAEKAAVDAERLGLLAPRPASLSADVLNDCHEELVLLRRNLEDRGADGRSTVTRIKATLIWPFEEQQMKKHIEMLHRFRSIFTDYVSASIL